MPDDGRAHPLQDRAQSGDVFWTLGRDDPAVLAGQRQGKWGALEWQWAVGEEGDANGRLGADPLREAVEVCAVTDVAEAVVQPARLLPQQRISAPVANRARRVGSPEEDRHHLDGGEHRPALERDPHRNLLSTGTT